MYEKLNKYSGEIAGKSFLNLIVLTIFFLSGCAMKFPVPDETNQTILIILVILYLPGFSWLLYEKSIFEFGSTV